MLEPMRRAAGVWTARVAAVRGRALWPGGAAGKGFGKLELAVVLVLVAWSALPWLWFGRDRPGSPPVDVGLAVLGAVQALPLLWRRQAPEAVLIAIGVAVGLGLLVHHRLVPASLALLVAAYGAPLHSHRRNWTWSPWLAWVVGAVGLVVFSAYFTVGLRPAPDTLFPLWVAVAWAVGRVRRQYLDLVDREREHHTRQALVAERARIARELHDLLAHSMSSMVVLAGVAQRVAASRPDRAKELLAAIESTGREGLEETQRLLGVLRSRDEDGGQEERDESDPLAPPPNLQQLGELVDPARSAGLDVRVEVEGEPEVLPAGVELSAYRIAQEALTNILRHAGATRAWLTLRYTEGNLEIEVLDNGTPTSGDDGGGYGLVGMRERVVTVGGSLDAGPRPEGGWRVLARLPVGGAP